MNVICICLDTFRADIVGVGKKLSFVETPNLDAFQYSQVDYLQGNIRGVFKEKKGLVFYLKKNQPLS